MMVDIKVRIRWFKMIPFVEHITARFKALDIQQDTKMVQSLMSNKMVNRITKYWNGKDGI